MPGRRNSKSKGPEAVDSLTGCRIREGSASVGNRARVSGTVGRSKGFCCHNKRLESHGRIWRMGPADPAPVPTVDGVAGGGVVP